MQLWGRKNLLKVKYIPMLFLKPSTCIQLVYNQQCVKVNDSSTLYNINVRILKG